MKSLKYLILISFLSPAVWALDTTETYPTGLSNFESYSGASRTQSSLTFVAGYGYSQFINPSLSVEKCYLKENSLEETHLSVGNFSNLYTGLVDIDLIASVAVHEQVLTSSVGTEVSIPLIHFTPYLRQFAESSGEEIENITTLGLSWYANSNIELFSEVSTTMASTSTAIGAVGLNYKPTETLELISEVAYDSMEEGTFGSVGVIWTRD